MQTFLSYVITFYNFYASYEVYFKVDWFNSKINLVYYYYIGVIFDNTTYSFFNADDFSTIEASLLKIYGFITYNIVFILSSLFSDLDCFYIVPAANVEVKPPGVYPLRFINSSSSLSESERTTLFV